VFAGLIEAHVRTLTAVEIEARVCSLEAKVGSTARRF
jgi:hypothetical protein